MAAVAILHHTLIDVCINTEERYLPLLMWYGVTHQCIELTHHYCDCKNEDTSLNTERYLFQFHHSSVGQRIWHHYQHHAENCGKLQLLWDEVKENDSRDYISKLNAYH